MIETKNKLTTVSPINGEVIFETDFASSTAITKTLETAKKAQKKWQLVPIEEKIKHIDKFAEIMLSQKEEIAIEITQQMGRPVRYGAGEIIGMADRAKYMCSIAERCLANVQIDENRFIQHKALGTVFVIAPWNYPFLTAINAIVPALLAGNTVILKHASQTPLCAERLYKAFKKSGLPEGVFQYLHLSHETTTEIISSKQINFVNFTGSVNAGINLYKQAANNLLDVGLELGGKDAAYVRMDANIESTTEYLADGAFFNSGQSCCGIERIYVHSEIYDEFLSEFIKITNQYVLGNPLESETTLGPMVSFKASNEVRKQIQRAIADGAITHIDEKQFPMANEETAYLAPQILTNLNHGMEFMREEIFGPAVGIMKVNSDNEAIDLINNSQYGLTGSIWTKNTDKGLELANNLEVGTCFINRCDYLDPALAWSGVKNTGLGCTLSELGFRQFTRPKSFLTNVIPT